MNKSALIGLTLSIVGAILYGLFAPDAWRVALGILGVSGIVLVAIALIFRDQPMKARIAFFLFGGLYSGIWFGSLMSGGTLMVADRWNSGIMLCLVGLAITWYFQFQKPDSKWKSKKQQQIPGGGGITTRI